MEDVDPVELPAFGIPAPKCAMASPNDDRRGGWGRGQNSPKSCGKSHGKFMKILKWLLVYWHFEKFTRCWLFMSRISCGTMRVPRRELCCAANLFVANIGVWCHLEKEHDKSEGCNAKLIPWATFCCPEFRVQAKKQTVRSGLRDTTHTKHWAHLRTTVKKNTKKALNCWKYLKMTQADAVDKEKIEIQLKTPLHDADVRPQISAGVCPWIWCKLRLQVLQAFATEESSWQATTHKMKFQRSGLFAGSGSKVLPTYFNRNL